MERLPVPRWNLCPHAAARPCRTQIRPRPPRPAPRTTCRRATRRGCWDRWGAPAAGRSSRTRGTGGTRYTFTLEAGERITAVTVWPGTGEPVVVRGLQLHTDRRDSPVYGLDDDPARQGLNALRLEVPGGSVFLGFAGREEAGRHIVVLGVKYGIESVFGTREPTGG